MTNPIILPPPTLSLEFTAIGETPSSGIVYLGNTVIITLTTDEPVTVDTANGMPTLSLNDNGTAVYDPAASKSDTSLVFTTTVTPTDGDVASLAVTSVNANGAVVEDGSGNAAALSIAGLTQTGPAVDILYNYATLNPPDASNPTSTYAEGINNLGQVVGYYGNNSGLLVDFVYSNGTWTAFSDVGLGQDQGFTNPSFATGINDTDQTVGFYVASSLIHNGLLFSGFTWSTLDDPLGPFGTQPAGINDQGQVVGTFIGDVGNGVERNGFLYSNGAWTTLDDPAAPAAVYGTQANGINNSGQIVGDYFDGSNKEHGFLYSGGTWTTLDDPLANGNATIATGINDAGEIVGTYNTTSDGNTYRGFIYSDGTYTTIEDPSAANGDTKVLGINDSGEIVGQYTTADGGTVGFEANVAPCYCPGTLIATDRGEVAVEDLAIGDKVVTASGAARPIKWIGRRSYGGRFVTGRKDILPVCVKAGSLADHVPKRDLWISPHHAMYFKDGNLDGVLIEAKDLVNGVSIVQAQSVDKVEYFHIELETHDVIVAEGALSETFLDDDSRGMFHNAHEYQSLYPDAAALAPQYCAARLDDGYAVEAARQRIALRAGLLRADEHAAGALRGYVDLVSLSCIAGWAQNVDYPEAPVCLDIYAGGRLIGQTLANRYRQDLEHAGLGSGHYSFEFMPPAELAQECRAVEVRRSLDGVLLESSSKACVPRPLPLRRDIDGRQTPDAALVKVYRRAARL